ncbi:MAG: tetratricopeptide repeat protein, partial [Gemmatimonadota bacterium]|nr:tetratricopeptide repeat protein [Gemmatimonadota bacterium]
GRHRDRLGPRDRTYLEARLSAAPRSSRETIETYEQLTRDLPDRVEAWYVLGDARLHSPLDPGPDWDEQTRAAFQRALDLDPNYFPATQHLTFLLLGKRRPGELQATMLRLRELSPSSVHPFHRGLEEGTGILTLDVDAIRSYLPISLALAAGVHLETSDEAPQDFLPFVETAVAERKRRAVDGRELRAALIAEYHVELSLGRSERAQAARERLIREFDEARLGQAAIDEALWSVGSLEDGEASVVAIDERLQSQSPESFVANNVAELANAEIWRFARDPDYRGRGAEARILQAMPGFQHPERLQVEAYARMLEAWSRTRAGLPAAGESVARVEEILLQQFMNRRLLFAMARIHEERGEYDQALRMLDRRVRFSGFVSPYEVTFWREEGRLAAQAGDTGRAVRAYERYLKARQDADSRVMPEVDSVRAELARLEAG